MSRARVIVKGGYISNGHASNTLLYAGDKIAKQYIRYFDGTSIEVANDKKIRNRQLYGATEVAIKLKDGRAVVINTNDYINKISEKITFEELKELVGDDNNDLPDITEARHMEDMDLKKYFAYISHRQGVTKDNIGESCIALEPTSTEEAAQMLYDYKDSVKWSYIISINPDDAKILGYDNRQAWEQLIKAKAPKIAKAYNISLNNLVVNAFYHDNKPHKHIHMIFYSKDKSEGFLYGGESALVKATSSLKSIFLNTIFQDEVSEIKSLINTNKRELKEKLLYSLDGYLDDNNLLNQFEEISKKLRTTKGKITYGYLPKAIKNDVNSFLFTLIDKIPQLKSNFDNIYSAQKSYIKMYQSDEEKVLKKLDNFTANFFNPNKKQAIFQNAILEAILKYNESRKDINKFKPFRIFNSCEQQKENDITIIFKEERKKLIHIANSRFYRELYNPFNRKENPLLKMRNGKDIFSYFYLNDKYFKENLNNLEINFYKKVKESLADDVSNEELHQLFQKLAFSDDSFYSLYNDKNYIINNEEMVNDIIAKANKKLAISVLKFAVNTIADFSAPKIHDIQNLKDNSRLNKGLNKNITSHKPSLLDGYYTILN